MKVAVIDGYTDEPSSLGVPPYIAPLPRYIVGAITDAGHRAFYLTIDDWRGTNNRWQKALEADIVVLVAGCIVPGRYLITEPVRPEEAREIGSLPDALTVIGGSSARFGIRPRGNRPGLLPSDLERSFDLVVKGDLDASIYDLLSGEEQERHRTLEEWDRWAVLGSEVVELLPPNHVVELDAARGCTRFFTGGCAFCSEPLHGEPVFRSPESVGREVGALVGKGSRHFRIGGMTDLFSYMAHGIGESETPIPDVKAVKSLLLEVSRHRPRIFHLDNANPAVMAAHPEETVEILRSVVSVCSPGNVLSLGMESADPEVIEANNLNATPDMVLSACRMIAALGARPGWNGLPALLPGLNFVLGLRAESVTTLERNMEFLRSIRREGIPLRRINIRLVIWRHGTIGSSAILWRFRSWVKEEIEKPNLKEIVPAGSVLRYAFTELNRGHHTFARQPGTYPIVIVIPYEVEIGKCLDIGVVGHGYRSVTGIVHPLDVNSASLNAIQALPGIGRRRALRILSRRPYSDLQDLKNAMDDPTIIDRLSGLIAFGTSEKLQAR